MDINQQWEKVFVLRVIRKGITLAGAQLKRGLLARDDLLLRNVSKNRALLFRKRV